MSDRLIEFRTAEILKENGMELANIAREIEVSQTTIKRWFNN